MLIKPAFKRSVNLFPRLHIAFKKNNTLLYNFCKLYKAQFLTIVSFNILSNTKKNKIKCLKCWWYRSLNPKDHFYKVNQSLVRLPLGHFNIDFNGFFFNNGNWILQFIQWAFVPSYSPIFFSYHWCSHIEHFFLHVKFNNF